MIYLKFWTGNVCKGGVHMNSMLEYKGYHATITYDADDELFVGEVFGIADSLNFHGASIEELKQTFAHSIDNYLDLCKQVGKVPEKEFKGSFNVRIPSDITQENINIGSTAENNFKSVCSKCVK